MIGVNGLYIESLFQIYIGIFQTSLKISEERLIIDRTSLKIHFFKKKL